MAKQRKIQIGEKATTTHHGEVVVLTVLHIWPDGSLELSASDGEGPVGCTAADWLNDPTVITPVHSSPFTVHHSK
jgi:hypothetical protein